MDFLDRSTFANELATNVSDVLANHKFSTAILICLSTLIYVAGHYANKLSSHNQTKIYTSKSYQSVTPLFNFKIDSDNLSENNSVYLTKFKLDGIPALFRHLISGVTMYFKTDPCNVYYLCVAVLLIYLYGDFRSTLHSIVLAGFVCFSTAIYMYSIKLKLKNQYDLNHKTTAKIVWKTGKLVDGNHVDVQIEKTLLWKFLKRGDLIRLTEFDEIPADILLINTSTDVNELELTGEDISVSKTGLSIPLQIPNRPLLLKNDPLIIINHHKNEGLVITGDQNMTYTAKNMIFRGTKIVNQSGFGIVIETGNDCKILRIDNDRQKKLPKAQSRMRHMLLLGLYLMLLLSSLTGVLIYSRSPDGSYSTARLYDIVLRLIVRFNAMVPISLPIFFITAAGIIAKLIGRDNAVVINNSAVTCFQVDPHYIVSDKTGTITTEKLECKAIIQNGDSDRLSPNSIPNLLACSELRAHAVTGRLLKTNQEEEVLATHLFSQFNAKLIMNSIDTNGQGELIFQRGDETHHYIRHYYAEYNRQLEVKLGVIQLKNGNTSNGNQMYLHIQGTPEAIQKYSDGRLQRSLDVSQQLPMVPDAYKREIAHASRLITQEELELLKVHPYEVLQKFESPSLYVFNDYVVAGMDQALTDLLRMGKHFTILTGDQQSSAIDIGRTIGLIGSKSHLVTIETLDDLDLFASRSEKQLDVVAVINGRWLDNLVCSNKTAQFSNIINLTRKIIIYRASPHGKKLYVSFLQSWFNREVMMVGDRSNDISALIQADIGLAVRHEDNKNVTDIADVIIESFPQIPQFLRDCKKKNAIIESKILVILEKHIITTFQLLAILYWCQFEQMRDPTNPIWANGLNMILFFTMCLDCQYTVNPPQTGLIKRSILGLPLILILGIFLGIFNTIVVFKFMGIETIDEGIKYCILLQGFELQFQSLYMYLSNHSIQFNFWKSLWVSIPSNSKKNS
jgi:magnesium-transporting ATPase (P-type)